MSHLVSTEFTTHLDTVVDFLSTSTGLALVYCNSTRLIHDLLLSLESKMNRAFVKLDVPHIHGSLKKSDKFSLIKLFCMKIAGEGFDP